MRPMPAQTALRPFSRSEELVDQIDQLRSFEGVAESPQDFIVMALGYRKCHRYASRKFLVRMPQPYFVKFFGNRQDILGNQPAIDDMFGYLNVTLLRHLLLFPLLHPFDSRMPPFNSPNWMSAQ